MRWIFVRERWLERWYDPYVTSNDEAWEIFLCTAFQFVRFFLGFFSHEGSKGLFVGVGVTFDYSFFSSFSWKRMGLV